MREKNKRKNLLPELFMSLINLLDNIINRTCISHTRKFLKKTFLPQIEAKLESERVNCKERMAFKEYEIKNNIILWKKFLHSYNIIYLIPSIAIFSLHHHFIYAIVFQMFYDI